MCAGIAASRRNHPRNFFFKICIYVFSEPYLSSPERPGCGAAPHLLSRRQPLRAAALLRTLASRSRKYSLSAEFPVIGTTTPRRRAQPSRGPWNTAAPRGGEDMPRKPLDGCKAARPLAVPPVLLLCIPLVLRAINEHKNNRPSLQTLAVTFVNR